VKRSSTPFLAVWGVVCYVLLAATLGCGSSGGPTGDPNASVASCNAYCEAYVAKSCPTPIYTSLDDCKMAECFHLPQAPAICQTKIKIYYDCVQALSNICDDCAQAPNDNCPDMGCKADFMAVLSCQ